MWDRLNLPMLLFKVGLLTLMYMDFMIFLAKCAPPFLLFGSCYGWWGGLFGQGGEKT